jgi:integrase
MTPRKRKSRIYWREQGGACRAWFDGRDYRDVGGRLEPLVAPGERFATSDPDVATRLASQRLQEFETARRRRAFHDGRAVETQLGAFARLHLIAKKKSGKFTDTWLGSAELFLNRAVAYFGAERELDTIRVSDVRGWIAYLERTTTPAKRRLGPGTIRHHLNTLSNLYRRAQEEEVVPPGYNPVSALMEKPTHARHEARWIEIPDAAVLLEAARRIPAQGGTKLGTETVAQIRDEWANGEVTKRAIARRHGVSNVWIARILAGYEATDPFPEALMAYPLLATYLLTGGRESEVTGLELDDISLDRKTITFRPNIWRRLKTPGSHRVVRLWPQLEAIMGPYLHWRLMDRGGQLLFPSPWSQHEQPIQDVRGILDRIAARAGLEAGALRTKMFRHTYCAARLQTLDRGAPVSTYTVARELGHESEAMVRRVYAHLGEVRHRSEVVEYRVDQHLEQVGDRLKKLGIVTGNVTADPAEAGMETPRDSATVGGADASDLWAWVELNYRPHAYQACALTT